MTSVLCKASLEFAQRALQEGALDRAFEHFSAASETEPKNIEAMIGKARILAQWGRLGDAEDLYIQGVEESPQQVQIWIELVQLEFEGGADEVARENLAAALRLHPGHPELLRLHHQQTAELEDNPAQELLDEIRAALFTQKLASANLLLAEMENISPDDPLLAVASAEIYLAGGNGRSSEHIHRLTKLTREDNNHWQALATLGRLFARKGPMRNPRMAAALCEDAWRISGEHPQAGLAVVEAWSAVGRNVHAHAMCKRLSQGQGLTAEVAKRWLEALNAEG